MGCDIHLAVEVRRNGKWERVNPPPEARDPWLVKQAQESDSMKDWYNFRQNVVWYDDRNYNCFAILANVRNGRGFAGCDTGDGFNPISEPRGLPNDMSDKVKKLNEPYNEDEEDNDINLGDHSFSWLTVKELVDYNWDQTTKLRGWVDPWNFEIWRKEGRPKSWSGGVSGSTIKHISNTQMGRMIDEGEIQWEGDPPTKESWEGRPYSTSLQRSLRKANLKEGTIGHSIAHSRDYYTQVEWDISYKEAAGRFYSEVLEHLKKLGPPEDVRIVFGFDN